MKKIFNIKICFICFLITSLPFAFISCDDDMFLTYFKCQLNGEEFKSPTPGIPFEAKNQPVFTIKLDESTTTYQLYTTIYPQDKSGDKLTYFLSLAIYCKEPLKIGENYFISKSSKEETLKDYVYLSISGTNNLGFGSGNIQLIEHNNEEKWYKGTVEFEFDSPVEEKANSDKIILKGEFCATYH